MVGCVTTSSLSIVHVSMVAHIDYDSLEHVNTTTIEPIVNELGYKLVNSPTPLNFYLYFYKDNASFPEFWVSVGRWSLNGTKYATFECDYLPTGLYKGDEEIAKEYIRERTNEIAEITNITIDWDKAGFAFDYGH